MAGENIITEFYKDCEIFLTGGSGVVGKATIDKLLRSCNVKRIYLLLRPKRNNTVEERLKTIKASKIFRVLKSQKPNELDKLVAIPGDAVLPTLGITPEYAKLMESVSIFFHCAATVRFNEPLDVAVRLNVSGTWEALKFAETLKKLKIFLHVSTFFSNPYLKRVEEKIYPSPIDWKLCLDMIQDESKHELLDVLTKKITAGFPNTYCFTKNLSETLVNSFRDRLPVAIYRPSIVLFAMNEPEPGFTAAMVGAMGLVTLIGAGIVKVVYRKKNLYADITPLDTGTIVMLVHTVLAAKKYELGNVVDIPLSQFSSRSITHHTFEYMARYFQDNNLWKRFAFEKCFMIPKSYFTESEWCYKLLIFTHQLIPAGLVDGVSKLFGRKPVMMEVMRKVFVSMDALTAFMHNEYLSNGITDLELLLKVTEGTEFSIKKIIVDGFTERGVAKTWISLVKQIREGLLNEDPSSLDRAKKNLFVKKKIYNITRWALVYYFLRSSSSIIHYYFN